MPDWNFPRAGCVRQAWIGLILAGLTQGQSFEVATVKLSPPPVGDSINFNLGTFRDGTFSMTNVTLNDRALPAERLHVTLRSEQKVLPHLALVAVKDGARIAPSTEPQLQGIQVRGRINHKQMPMSLLVSLLSRFERQTVVDRTGLTGAYAIQLNWAPDNALGPVIPDAAPPDRPNLFEAVQRQLGLKLESRRAPLDVLVVMQASQVPEDN